MRANSVLEETRLADARGGRSLLDELMTSRQLADALQMRVSTVEAYARRGLLPSIKLGRHRRFVRSEVERAIHDAAIVALNGPTA
jgi:excisionase family DNA binding protein